VLVNAGKYFLKKQQRSVGIAEEEVIKIAVKSLGLDELRPFDPQKKVIEYLLDNPEAQPLIKKTLNGFADETASESPAPGGGSIAAYTGALGAALGVMVANLSAHKRGWDDKWNYFSDIAEKGQNIKDRLIYLVDEDTEAFNKIMSAIRLPKSSSDEKQARKTALEAATKNAIEVPLRVMKTAMESYSLLDLMAKEGNPASVSDAGVGALCTHAAIHGACLNVQINCAGFSDEGYAQEKISKAKALVAESEKIQKSILAKVEEVINS